MAGMAHVGADEVVGLRQPPLADIGIAVHQLGGVVRVVEVVEPDLVAELVHQHGQQVHPAGGRAAGIGGEAGAGAVIFVIVAGGLVEEPAMAGAVAVDQDSVGIARAEIECRPCRRR